MSNSATSKPLCFAPFTSFNIYDGDNLSPCTMLWHINEYYNSDVTTKDTQLIDVVNHDFFVEQRKNILEGNISKLPDACKECITNPFIKNNVQYDTITNCNNFNELHSVIRSDSDTYDYKIKLENITSVNLNFHSANVNVVKLKSPIESSEYKTKLYKSNQQHIGHDRVLVTDENMNMFYKMDKSPLQMLKQLPSLTMIHLTGEDSLTYPYTMEIIKQFPDVHIRLATNGINDTFSTGEKFHDVIQKYKNITVQYDINGPKEIDEICRLGVDHETTITHITKTAKLIGKERVEISCAFDILTITKAAEIMTYLNALARRIGVSIIYCAHSNPEYYSIRNLPEDMKNEIYSLIKNQMKDGNYRISDVSNIKTGLFMKASNSQYQPISEEERLTILKRLKFEIDNINKDFNVDILSVFPMIKNVINEG